MRFYLVALLLIAANPFAANAESGSVSYQSAMSLAKTSVCSHGEILKHSNNKVTIFENGDPVGFCADAGARDLLQQTICQHIKSSSDCFQPAFLSFVNYRKDFAPQDVRRGSGSYALEKILRRGSVPREKCLDVHEIFPHLKPSIFGRWWHSYEEKYTSAVYQSCLNSQIHNCRNNKTALEQLSPAICASIASSPKSTPYTDRRISKYIETKHCPEVPIPKLKVRNEFFDGSKAEQVQEKLNKLLSGGHIVEAFTNSPHALVISNYRIRCSFGVPKLQYQTIDSLSGTQWSDAKKTGDWIDGTKLVKSLNMPHGSFQWLEP
jgi:hypothetical protein